MLHFLNLAIYYKTLLKFQRRFSRW